MIRRKRRQLSGSDEAAQMHAVRAWVGTFFPKAQGIDADEAPDQVECAGSSMVVLTGIYTVEWPAKCPGVMCYRPADDCNVCIHGGAKHAPEEQMDMTDVEELLKKFASTLHLPPRKMKPMFQSRNEALFDLFSFAPASRGRRAQHELGLSLRLGV